MDRKTDQDEFLKEDVTLNGKLPEDIFAGTLKKIAEDIEGLAYWAERIPLSSKDEIVSEIESFIGKAKLLLESIEDRK